MIREKHLIPGRVLLRWTSVRQSRTTNVGHSFIDAWVPCMIISYLPDVRRRHLKSSGPRLGWDVLVFWLDNRYGCRLETVRIPNRDEGWKVGW